MSGRKTHFTLGQNNQNQSISVFKHSFVDFKQDFQPAESQKKNRKCYRFEQNPITNYATTNGQLFQNPKGSKYSQLSAEKIEDLKSHHFTMGNYESQNLSVAKQNYTEKEYINNNSNQQNKVRMRCHNHKFSEQDFTNMVSAYSNQYVGNDQDNNELQLNKEATQNKLKEIRDSHIVLGNDQVGIESIAKRDFRSMSLQDAKQTQVNQLREKLQIGTAKDNFQTINQVYFDEKEIDLPNLDLTKDQVQGTHFVLGSDQNYFNSEVQRQYEQKNVQLEQNHVALKQDNFNLGCQEFALNNHFQTSFSKNMTKYNNYYVNPIKKDHYNQKNNVCFGNHNLQNTSEKEAKYPQHKKTQQPKKTIFQQDTDILQRNTQQQKITEFQKNFTNDKKSDVNYNYVSQQLHHFTNGQDPQNFFRSTQQGFMKHVCSQQQNKHYSTTSNFKIS